MKPVDVQGNADSDWITGLRAGNADAAAALRGRIRKGLGAALAGRSDVHESDLDDFSQQAVIRVLERLDTFRGDSSFATWAMAVAIRVSLTALRRRRGSARSLDEHAVEVESREDARRDGSMVGARRELFEALRQAIEEQLTPRQRQVLLSELEGIPQVVLADRLSASPGAIYKTSHDARKKLKRALAQAGFDSRTVVELLAGA